MRRFSTATRREFLKKFSALTVMRAATPLTASLSLMNNAAAQTATNDYKALVCVFLYGGNDHFNTLVPYATDSYRSYRNFRGNDSAVVGDYSGIAILREKLRSLIAQGGSSVLDHALHPAMDKMQTLFQAGRAGIVMNVGPLIQPTTLDNYLNRRPLNWPLPPHLMSHNNQQAYWQTAARGETAPAGWGGRLADLFLSDNKHANLTCLSVTGDALLLSGNSTVSTKLSTTGVSTFTPLNNSLTSSYGNLPAAVELIKNFSTTPGQHLMTAQYAQVMSRSMSTYDTVSAALAKAGHFNPDSPVWLPSAVTDSPLAKQLQMVARMIQQNSELGIKRQVFMVGLGGFDLHDNLPTQHPKLLKMLSDACADFDAAMVKLEMKGQLPTNSVTTFTASDFGRTLASNGDGSDHGWGSHHFVMGGAVNGGKLYGTAPDYSSLTNRQSFGGGILIPTTSLEQMFVPMARWFGVQETQIQDIFPHAKNFDLNHLRILFDKS